MELVIAYSTDDNYVQHVGVSMISLFESNKEFDNIIIYIMDNNISDINKDKLVRISQQYNRTILFIDVEKLISTLKLDINGSIALASYARLFLASIVDKKYDKVLYLDCDSIISNSFKDLWCKDLNNYFVSGVLDTVDCETKTKIGLKENDIYINAGMMLINLKEWRERNIQNDFIEFIDKYNGNVFHHDQGVINGVLNKRIDVIEPKYNCMTPFFNMKKNNIMEYYNVNEYYSQEELDLAIKNPVFIHFTPALSNRPWIKGCTHPLKNEYIKYLNISPWKDSELLEDNRSKGLKLVCTLYEKLPFKIAHKICKTLFK